MVVETPVRWLDAFPPGISNYRFFDSPSGELVIPENAILSQKYTRKVIEDIAHNRAFGTYFGEWSAGTMVDLFPSLAHLTDFDELDLPTPIKNLILRAGVSNLSKFLNLTFEDFQAIRGAGYSKTLQLSEILVRMVLNQVRRGTFWSELQGAMSIQEVESEEDTVEEAEISRNPDRLEAELALIEEITKFAYFLNYRSQQDSPIVATASTIGTTNFNNDYNSGLSLVTAGKWLSEFSIPTMPRLIDLFEESLQASPVMTALLRERIFSPNPKSLDQVGDMVNLTRERVRQIEKTVTSKFEKYLEDDEYLVHAVRAVKSFCTVPVPEAELLKLLPTLTEKSNSGVRVIDFMSYFGGIEFRDGWYCNSFAATKTLIDSAIERSQDEFKVIDNAKFVFFAGKDWYSSGSNNLASWLKYLGYQSHKDKWISGSSLPQLAFLVLSGENRALTGAQIMEALDTDRTIRSLENSLAADERFVRVNKSEWGLVSWGLEAYGGIQEAIGNYIDEHGSTPIDQLIAIFAPKFKVKPASIRAYASGGQFAIVDGFVKRSAAVRVGRKGVTETKNLYKTAHGFALRITIKFDHIRGSGSSCPAALTTAYGVTTGTKKTFSYGVGEISISQKSLTSNLTSIKKVCDNLSLEEGDQCMLFFSDATVTAKKIDVSKSGEELVSELVGLPDIDNLANRLSGSFDLDKSVTLTEICELAESRNETDLCDALKTII